MKRMDRDDEMERSGELATGLAAAETMRNAVESSHVKEESAKKEDEKLSIYWRVFGGTVVSIVALVAINLVNNLYGSISEIRNELNKEREARGDCVKKDEFHTRITAQYERIRAAEGMQNTLAALRSEHDSLKEAIKGNSAAVEGVKKDTAALDSLRERLTNVEAMKKEIAGLDVAKEKLAALALDLKTLRDDFNKVNQEITQNRAFDLERKALRDSQAKQFEDGIKEVNKGMQEIREKLARMEAQPPSGPTVIPKAPKSVARPKTQEVEVAPAPGDVTPVSGTKE